MNKTETAVICNLTKRLSKDCDLDPNLIPHREALRLYLDIGVIVPMELLVKEGRTEYNLKIARDMSAAR